MERNIENLNKEIKSLMDRHFESSKLVEEAEKHLSIDGIELEKLKKEKLKIKDKILIKQSELTKRLNT